MSTRVHEACCRHIAASERDLCCDRKVGQPFEPRGEEADCGLFSTDTGRRFWCRSAHLVIYVILCRKRSEPINVVGT